MPGAVPAGHRGDRGLAGDRVGSGIAASVDISRRVICAPNAFKGTLTAATAAAAMARGVTDAGATAVELPVADGGDGTLDVLLANAWRSTTDVVPVTGPLGTVVEARLGFTEIGAVVELAEAAGLRRVMHGLDALSATSHGVGQLIVRAIEAKAKRVIVGVGGSACTDGGAGMLQALGARLLNATGEPIGEGGVALLDLERIDLDSVSDLLLATTIDVAVDVRSPLLGFDGAAAVFGPQKGASPEDVRILEAGLARFAAVAERDCGAGRLAELPGAGAAGGCGFGLALIGAQLRPGATLVCDLVGLDTAISGSQMVLTGEGRLDSQTASGKAPHEVALRARRAGVPCAVIAGDVVEPVDDVYTGTVSLREVAGSLDVIQDAETVVREAARTAVERFS